VEKDFNINQFIKVRVRVVNKMSKKQTPVKKARKPDDVSFKIMHFLKHIFY